jgi:hypothetical protein
LKGSQREDEMVAEFGAKTLLDVHFMQKEDAKEVRMVFVG